MGAFGHLKESGLWILNHNLNLRHGAISVSSNTTEKCFFTGGDCLQIVRRQQLYNWSGIFIVNFQCHLYGCAFVRTVDTECGIAGPDLDAVCASRQVPNGPVCRPSCTSWLIEEIVIILRPLDLKPNALDITAENSGICIRCTAFKMHDTIVNLRSISWSIDPNGRWLCIQFNRAS